MLYAAAKSLQSCPTLCNPMDCSPPGLSIHGILQARTLEWAAISFSNAWKYKVKVKSLNRVRLLATPWTAAHKAPPSMGFSGQQYWSTIQPEILTISTTTKTVSLKYSGLNIQHIQSNNKCYINTNKVSDMKSHTQIVWQHRISVFTPLYLIPQTDF